MEKNWMKEGVCYMLVFVILFLMNLFLRWCSGVEDFQDGNLLVNFVFTACPTVAIILGYRYWHKKRESGKNSKI